MIYKRAEHIAWQQFEAEALLLDINTGRYYRLNAVGTRLWTLLDGQTSEAQLSEYLTTEFGLTPEIARRDCDQFLAQLAEKHLIIAIQAEET